MKEKTIARRSVPNHKRSQNDFLAVMVDAISAEDWRQVTKTALEAAKSGDNNARNWLSAYLIGRANSTAPTPLEVTVMAWSDKDPVAVELAEKQLKLHHNPFLREDEAFRESTIKKISAQIHQSLIDIE